MIEIIASLENKYGQALDAHLKNGLTREDWITNLAKKEIENALDADFRKSLSTRMSTATFDEQLTEITQP